MKSRLFLMVMGLMLALFVYSSAQVPQMINYQGKLASPAGAPITDTLQIVFTIYADEAGTIPVWTETQPTVEILKGVFNVLLGSVNPIAYSVFDGSTRYLGVQVGGDPEITTRKAMVSVAYAMRAGSGGGGADSDWIFRVTDGYDTTLMTGGAWGIARYGNVLYGNADSTHVNLGVACTTGSSGQNYKYSTVGGGYGNTASWGGATVGGGEGNTASSGGATVGGGATSTASANCATVGGGNRNTASQPYATVGGGFFNTASGWFASIGGGYYNTASVDYATVGGGYLNTASGRTASIGGGESNTASGDHATVGGGLQNIASGYNATVGGGLQNIASGIAATVGGGYADTAAGDLSFAAGNQVRLTASADYTFAFGNNFTTSSAHSVIFHDTNIPIKVGIGTTSPNERLDVEGTVKMTGFKMPTGASNGYVLTSDASGVGTWQAAGGTDKDWAFRVTDTADTALITGGAWGIARYGNVLYGNKDSTHVNLGVACTTGTEGNDFSHSTVGGGLGNTASGGYATIGGGWRNTANNGSATVGGGHHNVAGNGTATVGGGSFNTATGWAASIGGGESNNASGSDATLGGGESNTASGDHAMVGGGYTNTASTLYATVSGGSNNIASDTNATVGGGYSNTASSDYAVVAGGYVNTASEAYATVGGGHNNYATSVNATVGGGHANTAGGQDATIAGGGGNTISGGWYATISGGSANYASGSWGTILGGYGDTASADYSFAAGRQVKIAVGADHTFAFGRDFTTSTANAVIFHNSITPIKVGIGTTSPTTTLHVQGDAIVKSTGGSVSLSGGDGCLEVWGTDGAYIDLKDSESDDYDFRITQVGGTSNLGLLGGNVGIGHTGPTEKLDVNGTARLRSMSTGTGTDVVVDANGVLLKKSSSIRYKQNIRELSSDPLQILQLKPVRFDWKTTGEEDVGLIAEEVEKMAPDLVIYDKLGNPDAVKYDKVAIYLLEVVKAQQQQIEDLKSEVERIKSSHR